ncbi:DUF2911 domain-containing protein [Arcticibacterium luteifluviistationis]|uniref:DUF2911 domain-containing protein n=1 Tax=Arcticibacterium luteifluviistationis TaxID=1784714 RepID=A0A2Z4GEZ1_9BACT|nr:DUF2911 domain-containing protein [Arcticibacterium luteifluviistationis]AWV99605.1 hypothetical protein DJ013_16075 [Arcticibacterium luteifluviistationis]
MKKLVKILIIVAAVLAVGYFVLKNWTKSHSPEDTAEITANELNVKVEYCQTAVKGRVIFGELVPFDRVWRTGANEATVISFNKDVKVAGKSLAAGEYSLWTIPREGDWTIVFNSQTGQWGTSYDEATDVLRVDVPSSQTSESTELFKISLVDVDTAGVNMSLKWDKTLVQVPID